MMIRNCVLLLTLLATTACASTPEREPHDAVAAVQPPALVDCADFTSPESDLSRQFVDVVVPVVVDESGSVTGTGAPRASRSRSDRQLLDRAVSLARSCSFEPAMSGGSPVPGRTEVRFRLGVG